MAEPDKVDVAQFGMPQWGSTSSLDYGLERTPFSVGEYRQTKPWRAAHITSRLSWLLPASKLGDFHANFLHKATAWAKVPMETVLAGDPGTLPAIAWQQVRAVSGIEMKNLGGGWYEISYDVEHRQGVPTETVPVTP